MRLSLKWLAFVLLMGATARAQEIELRVELMNNLATGSSRKGDRVSGRVISPAALRGDILEGKVTKAEAGGKVRGKSVLTFSFETLKHGGRSIPIASQVQSVSNSKGEVDVDEEGHVIRKSNNIPKILGGTGAGALVGGLAAGGKGAAIGAGAGALISVVLIDIAADSPSIQLAPGSKITLRAKSRSGPSLSSLRPNRAPAEDEDSEEPVQMAAAAPASAAAASPSAAASASPAQAQSQSSSASAGRQPNLTAVKSDFIPGDKTLFYDDFTDMVGDEPPPHWKVRGGTAELRVGEGVRQLTMTSTRMDITPNLKEFPKNFTMESTVAYKGHGGVLTWRFLNQKNVEAFQIRAAVNYKNYSLHIRCCNNETLTSQQLPMDWTKPIKQALWVQNGRVRFYVNDQRVMDVNQIELPELKGLTVLVNGPGGNDPSGYVGIQYVRFAESSPDFSKIITSSGRYVTHGILFDTDSDRIKPESASVIQMIARGLTANPALNLLVEGHTDSVGNADHNLDLSRRRAEAVKAVLVSQFNIDAGRLSTAGLGATKPISDNDTPQGRAQNRRVELVKQ